MLDKRPFFSVVIPTLNEEKYLPKLLKDLRAQLDRDFEVVVVDGFSEDGTVKMAKRNKGLPNLQVLSSDKRGVGYQMNVGARATRGKYLVFIGADAGIPINFLSEVHTFLFEKGRNCRFLATWMEPDNDETADGLMVEFVNVFLEATRQFRKPLVAGSGIVVRRDLFNILGGFDERLKLSEDHDLAQRAHKIGVKIETVRDPKVVVSMRRFKRGETLRMLGVIMKTTYKTLKGEKVVNDGVYYPMGGKV